MESYRSPLRKVAVFFRKSRDKWKNKCQDAKHELKLLKRRYANLERSRDRWRQQYREAEAECLRLCAQVEVLSKK